MTRLLLIDDEKTNVDVMALSLRSDGYEVLTSSSGEEGLEIFDRESPDIVITDIKMPGMDGIEVLKAIKEHSDMAEVIIITGHGDVDNAIEALKYGASDFINKPVRDETLAIALKRAKSKISIRKRLDAYTKNLEEEVARVTHELRMQSNFLEKLIKTSEEGIIATDRQFTVIIYNPAAEHILGYPAEEVLDKKKAKELFSLDLMRKFQAKRHDPRKRKKLEHFETLVKNHAGDFIPVRFTGVFLYEKGKIMGSVAFLQDLREIKHLQKELLMSERLSTIGQTVAGMAHGVKNILHGFKGGSYLMEVGFKNNDNGKLKSGWEMIQKHISRTSDLVMDLLTYSKVREPEYKPCRPNEIVQEVCQSLRQRATEHDVQIIEELDARIGERSMNGNTIHTILMNLVANAIDACIIDETHGKNLVVRVNTLLEHDGIIMEVTDTGTGMPRDIQEKIFNSFFSTKGPQGTGLGLLVTGKLIEDHNGAINLWSEEGKGTGFKIKLPFKEFDELAYQGDSTHE